MTQRLPTLAELDELLARHGAELGRWPARERATAEALLRVSSEARTLLAEASAFEATLAKAPAPRGDLSRLADRIVAAAATQPQLPSQAATVIPMPVPARPRVAAPALRSGGPSGSSSPPQSSPARVPATVAPARRLPELWRAAVGLAASLVIGVAIGSLELAPASLQRLVATASQDQDVELFVSSLAGDGLTPSLDEDYL